MRDFIKRFWPLLVFVAFVIVVLCFIAFAGENDPSSARYLDGIGSIELDGVTYRLFNEETGEDAEKPNIGSMVSSILMARRGERIASIRSYGLLTMAVIYTVQGDETRDILVDSNDRIYVKSDVFEEKKAYYTDEAHFTEYRIVDSTKQYDKMRTISAEAVACLQALTGEELVLQNAAFTEDFSNRREIFAFSDDGLLYKASMELFYYEGTVYLTTDFIDGSAQKVGSTLKGAALPEEWQAYFADLW